MDGDHQDSGCQEGDHHVADAVGDDDSQEGGAAGGEDPPGLAAILSRIIKSMRAARRSSRANLGLPANRYGDWVYGSLLAGIELPDVKGTPQPLFSSTQANLAGTSGAPGGNLGVALDEDDDEDDDLFSEVSDGQANVKKESFDEALKALERRTLLQAENAVLKKTLLEMQIEKGLFQPKQRSYAADERQLMQRGDGAEADPLVQGAARGDIRFRPTPRSSMSLWRPFEDTPRASTEKTSVADRPPQQKPRRLYKEKKELPPSRNVYTFGQVVGQTPPQHGQGWGPAVGQPPRQQNNKEVPVVEQNSPQQAQDGGMGALANAIVQALQGQNRQTEKFVARQSKSSELPLFTGNPLDWPLFAHHFRQSTEDCGFSPAQNMARLEKALRGEARRMVRSLMIVPTNTNAVMERLEQRYGRPEFIIGALMDIARRTPTPKESRLSTFIDYSNAISNLITTIESLEVPAYRENPQLLQELVEKLPDSFKIQWGMKRVQLCSAGANLLDFSEWVSEIAEAASMVSVPKFSLRDKEESSFSADEVSPLSSSCVVCQEDHSVANCEKFKKLDSKDRWNVVKRNNLCFRCLRANHSIRDCRSKVTCRAEGCSRRHHTLLHGPPEEMDWKKQKAEDINATMMSADGGTLLRIVVVTLYGKSRQMTCNALLDEGSTVTLISSDVADFLGLGGVADPLKIKWTDGTVQSDNSSKKVHLWIGPDGEEVKYNMKRVRTVQNLRLPAQRTDLKDIAKQYPHLQQHRVRYLPGQRPLILIGQPHIHLSVAREVEEKDDRSPIMTRTKLGWVIHGPNQGESSAESAFLGHHESDDGLIHNIVKESFSLESTGILAAHSTRSKEDFKADERMNEMTRRVGDRWETGLLLRQEPVTLPRSRDVALSRLQGTKRNGNLAKQCSGKIVHNLECVDVRKVSEDELSRSSKMEWYLPHFDREDATASAFVEENPKAVKVMAEPCYMDERLQSGDSGKKVMKLVLGVQEIHRRGGPGKWIAYSRKPKQRRKSDQSTAPIKGAARWVRPKAKEFLKRTWGEVGKNRRQSQALAALFWRRWVSEYVPTLQRRAKWHHQQPSIGVGDIVVVEILKRNSVPLGIVTQTFPGKDGIVRVAEVKTDFGIYRRPVVKLGKLHVKQGYQKKD